MTDMLRPGDHTPIVRDSIEEMAPSEVSMMPSGLLNTLTAAEIIDLLAYLRSGGDASHELYRTANNSRK